MFQSLRFRGARRPVSGVAKDWLLHIQGLSKLTQSSYKHCLYEFLSAIPDRSIDKITTIDIRNFINKKLWHIKKSSVNNSIIAIRSFFRFAAESYGIPNPARTVKKFKPDLPYQPFISRSQYEEILKSATQRESDVIKMLAMGGFRVSELCSLKWSCLSPQATTIRFQGKGGRTRTVPVNKTMREIISRYPRSERFLNLPKNRKSIYRICRRAGKRTNTYLAPHVLRRFFASQLVERRVSLLIVSELLGHASVSQTEQYLKIDSSFLYGATDCLD